MKKTNAKEIREKKAKREGKKPDDKPKNFAEKLATAVPELAAKLPKQLHLDAPGMKPKVHKSIEIAGDAFQEAHRHKKSAIRSSRRRGTR